MKKQQRAVLVSKSGRNPASSTASWERCLGRCPAFLIVVAEGSGRERHCDLATHWISTVFDYETSVLYADDCNTVLAVELKMREEGRSAHPARLSV